MKKLRDFFYDKNDIILALIILAVAGLLIVWRIDVIMAYPETLAKETKTEQTTQHDAVDKAKDDKAKDKDKEKADDKAKESTKEETQETSSVWDGNGKLSADLNVTVSGASSTDALNSLVNAGLFSSPDEVSKDFANNGTSVESLKSGTFTFSKGASKADVISILTQ